MKGSSKALALFIVVLAAVGGTAWWALHQDGDDTDPNVTTETARPKNGSTPVAEAAPKADAVAVANREAEPAAPAPETTEVASVVPTAEYLSGVVTDSNGRPVAGAVVSFGTNSFFGALGRRGGGRDGRRGRFGPVQPAADTPEIPTVTGTTGPDGIFKLLRVPREEGLELKVDHADYVVYTRNDLIVPSNGLEVGRVQLEAGGIVSGQVFGPSGEKMAGAEVSLQNPPNESRRGGFGDFRFGPRGNRTVVTNDDGLFRLSGMPKGSAVVQATKEGFVEATSSPIEVQLLQEVPNIVLHLESGFTVKGVVRDGSAKPVAEAKVSAATGDGFNRFIRLASTGEPDAVTDAEGHFELKGLKGATYQLDIEATGFARKQMAGIDPASGAFVEVALVTSAHVAGTVHIKGSSETPKAVKVALTPYWGEDNSGFSGLSGLGIETPDAANTATSDGSFLVADVEPGQYRVVARADGTTRAMSAPITVPEAGSVEDIVVEVERGGRILGTIFDASGAPLAGAEIACFQPRVIDPNSGFGNFGRGVRINSRIGGNRIRFDPTRQSAGSTKSGPDGSFTVDHLAPGTYTLEVSHPDFATLLSDPQAIEAAATKSGLELRLRRGGSIEGTVFGVDGKPRPGDRVDVESKAVEGVSLSAVADGNGFYRIEHVPAGDAVAKRSANDGRGGGPGGGIELAFRAIAVGGGGNEPDPGKTVAVTDSETTHLDFSQVEKPYIEGVVTSAEGVVAGALVSVQPDYSGGGGGGGRGFGFGPPKQATTGADGSYRLADLEPGKWTITARHPQGLVPQRVAIELVAGTPGRQDFVLDGGVIEGDALAQGSKQKLEGATVWLSRVESDPAAAANGVAGEVSIAIAAGGPTGGGRRGGGGGFRSFRFGGDGGSRVATDRDGHYRVPWVPAGKYKVSVRANGYLETQSDEVELAANGHVDGVNVALLPAAQLHVKVMSKADGKPAAGVSVQLQSEDGNNDWSVSDADGIASFDSLKPGKWTATARRDFNPNAPADGNTKSADCAAGRVTEITMDL